MRIGFGIRFSERVGDERARRRALLRDGDAMWCLGLPVCRWQRVNGNPKISMPFGGGAWAVPFSGERIPSVLPVALVQMRERAALECFLPPKSPPRCAVAPCGCVWCSRLRGGERNQSRPAGAYGV